MPCRGVQSRLESTVRACSRLASKDGRNLERLHPGERGPCGYNTPSSQLSARKALQAFGGAYTPWAPGYVLPDVFSLTGKTSKKKKNSLSALERSVCSHSSLHLWLRHGKNWPPGSMAPQVPSTGDTQLHPSSRCPPPNPTRPGCVAGWPVFLPPN